MPRLAPELIDQIVAANDIVDVVGSYFALKRAGGLYKATCPFHDEKTPSFSVNPQRQIFKCFGCGVGGSVIRFVMMYEKLDFVAAAKKLAARAGIRVIEQEMSPEDEARVSMRRRLLALHAEAADFFHWQLLKKPGAQMARDYLKTRGIGSDIAKNWKLGYAPDDWEAFTAFAHGRGYESEEIVQSGLVKLRDEDQPHGDFYDRFRGRVMFPICNDTEEVIAFSGRVLAPDAKAAKYVNSPETMLFTKGAVLFGLHKSKRALIEKSSAIVCEGQLDLITAYEHGIQNVIAPQGTAFTEKQAHILRRFVDEVLLCFDADTAGEKAAERSLGSLLAENLTVRVVAMPPGEDPDSLIRNRGAEAFQEVVRSAKDFFDHQLDRAAARADFATPRGRVQTAHRLAGTVGLIGDSLLRSTVASKVARRLEIAPEEFMRMLPRRDHRESKPVAVSPPASRAIQLDPTVRLLSLVALHDETARAWMLEEPWQEFLQDEPGTEFLMTLLGGDFSPSDPATVRSFLSTLTAEEESAATMLLEEKAPEHALAIAHDGWREMECRKVRRALEKRYAQLRAPGVTDETVGKLQKEVLDLKSHLSNISRPLSPPL